MKYRQYKGIDISLLGMGNMRLPVDETKEGKPIDYDRACEIIDYAMANGINYYDTAYVYHSKTSEDFLGKALVDRYPRDKFMLATKYNIDANPDFKACFEEQLEKLHTDCIDFYLIHAINPERGERYIESGCIEYFLEQKKAGRIKNIGFSTHAPCDYLRKFVNVADWDFAQIQLNYFDWLFGTAKEEYEILREKNLPIMVMESIRGGRLSQLTPEAERILKAKYPNMSISSWALRWLMTLPGIQVILSGMSTLDQIKDNVATFDTDPLTPSEIETLFVAAEKFHTHLVIPCTGCRYCTDGCPAGIDIPEVLKVFNDFKVNGAMGIKARMEAFSAGPADCIGCGQCTGHCPQSIRIPDLMAEFAEKLEKL